MSSMARANQYYCKSHLVITESCKGGPCDHISEYASITVTQPVETSTCLTLALFKGGQYTRFLYSYINMLFLQACSNGMAIYWKSTTPLASDGASHTISALWKFSLGSMLLWSMEAELLGHGYQVSVGEGLVKKNDQV